MSTVMNKIGKGFGWLLKTAAKVSVVVLGLLLSILKLFLLLFSLVLRLFMALVRAGTP